MKGIIFITLFFISSINYSQEKMSLGVFQDARLMFLGDERGNSPGTMDLLLRLRLEGKQKKIGYFVFYLSYEHANLASTLKRYSSSVGFTFNNLSKSNKFINRFEFTPTVGYGNLNRNRNDSIDKYYNWSFCEETSFKVNEFMKISFLTQLMQRSDLKRKKSNNRRIARFSCFIGTVFNI